MLTIQNKKDLVGKNNESTIRTMDPAPAGKR